MRVAIADVHGPGARHAADELSREGGACLGLKVDVTDFDNCRQAAERVHAWAGDLEILVNNAGISVRTSLDNPDFVAAHERVMAVNVTGSLNIARAVLDQLKRSRGSILNMGSRRWLSASPAFPTAPRRVRLSR